LEKLIISIFRVEVAFFLEGELGKSLRNVGKHEQDSLQGITIQKITIKS
jgi:hypothetical protein